MVFLALLTKELRTRMRRERTIWLMIIYVLLLGAAGWLVVQTTSNTPYQPGSSITGTTLYYTLAILQFVLIIFITPAFTATAINGEKERQTFDLLLCSRLSSLALVTGKLVAGMVNALLLIASSVPLFSLLLFFGGVAPITLLIVLWLYIVTALLIGTGSLFLSIILPRPAISTAIAYVANLFWLGSPLLVMFLWYALTRQGPSGAQTNFMLSWSPFAAVVSLTPDAINTSALNFGNNVKVALWIGYSVISLFMAAIFFIVSAELARPGGYGAILRRRKMAAAPLPDVKLVPLP
ncbi:MAG: ABC transporter permease [Ktedonobacteraceae bacterium]|nr:ABC transporter permease [Ktedonobacteraceae bacterium]